MSDRPFPKELVEKAIYDTLPPGERLLLTIDTIVDDIECDRCQYFENECRYCHGRRRVVKRIRGWVLPRQVVSGVLYDGVTLRLYRAGRPERWVEAWGETIEEAAVDGATKVTAALLDGTLPAEIAANIKIVNI